MMVSLIMMVMMKTMMRKIEILMLMMMLKRRDMVIGVHRLAIVITNIIVMH